MLELKALLAAAEEAGRRIDNVSPVVPNADLIHDSETEPHSADAPRFSNHPRGFAMGRGPSPGPVKT